MRCSICHEKEIDNGIACDACETFVRDFWRRAREGSLNPPTDVPRFVHVTLIMEGEPIQVLLRPDLIKCVSNSSTTGILIEGFKGTRSVYESFETIISRIREVGGVVSGYEEVK